MRKRALALLATAIACGGVLAAGSAASAAPRSPNADLETCSPTNTHHSDPYHPTWTRDTRCHNAEAPVYDGLGFTKGYLNATSGSSRSWFLCYLPDGDFNSSGPFGGSTYWYYTHGDRTANGASNSWGFVASSYVNTSDPAKGIPECGFRTVPNGL